MSRLIDKLKQVADAASQPIGFRSARTATPKPQMVLIASLTNEENAGTFIGNVSGADAVLLPAAKAATGAGTRHKRCQPAPDIPWGKRIEDADQQEIAALDKNGCDFLVFPASAKVPAIPEDENLGKVLQIESSLDEGLVKAIGQSPLDAVLVSLEDEAGQFLTWHQLLLLQRLASISTKPVLVFIPPDATTDKLKALWEAGIDGVVTEMSSKQPKERIQEFRQAIQEFSSRSPHRRGKKEALLPHVSEKTESAADVEEDE
jgi:hypothetical protein